MPPQRCIRFERRPIAPGETYPLHVAHTPTEDEAPYPDGMTEKLVLIHEGIEGGPYEVVMVDHTSGLPMKRLDWED